MCRGFRIVASHPHQRNSGAWKTNSPALNLGSENSVSHGPQCPCGKLINKVPPALIAQLVKNAPAMQETPVWFLGREDPLEKGKATQFSTLAWRSPWNVLYSSWGCKGSDMTEQLSLSVLHVVALRKLADPSYRERRSCYALEIIMEFGQQQAFLFPAGNRVCWGWWHLLEDQGTSLMANCYSKMPWKTFLDSKSTKLPTLTLALWSDLHCGL